MDIERIVDLIYQGESSTVEFKRSTAQLKPAFETLNAFLNSHGGTVLIGVNAKGQLIGQDVTDSTRQEIAKEVAKLEPSAEIDIKYVPIHDRKNIISLQVLSGKYAPYVYNGRPYQREQSTTIKMTQHRSCPRNPLIAKVLYACKMIEMWGRGTEDMVEMCQDGNYPLPVFSQTNASFTVTLPFKEPITRVNTFISPVELTLAPRQKEILKVLSKAPANRVEIKQQLTDPPSDRMVQVDLAKLRELGLIVSKGKAKSLIWDLSRNNREIIAK